MTRPVGLVVVSHSQPLAEAAVELATQMVADDPPPIAVAAGTADGGLGTDAMAVMAAIEEVASDAGVLVFTDLGSALMSAETAREFLGEVDYRIELTAAPLVEGLVAAVVQAALGSDLDTVSGEASGAIEAKLDHVGGPPGEPPSDGEANAVQAEASAEPDVRSEVQVVNELGLHARPAAALVRTAGRHDARVDIVNLSTGAGPTIATSLSGLARLGARHGHRLQVDGTGPGARAAVDAVRDLVDEGFGEPVIPVEGDADAPSADDATADVGQRSDDRDGAGDRDGQRPDWAPPAADAVMAIAPGRAAGPVVRLPPTVVAPLPGSSPGPGERDRGVEDLRVAAEEVAAALEAHASAVDDEQAAAIVAATAVLAQDPEVLAAATQRVREDGLHPAAAVIEAFDDIGRAFREAGGRLAERRVDVEDVRDRIVARLLDQPMREVPTRDHPFVLVADDLAPTDTATLSGSNCVALVVRDGGPTSHTAIIARRLGIPAIVAGAQADRLTDGDWVLVDAIAGRLEVDPPRDVASPGSDQVVPVPGFDGSGRTSDGHPVALLANVGGIDDVRAARAANAQGIGLLRTEFLFLGRHDEPDHDDQVSAYRSLVEPFAGDTVVVRTLDAGSDKPLPFLAGADEPNPALGIRGLRTAWSHPGVLDRQLAAIAEAASGTGAHVRVMAPMVATPAEAAMFAAACAAHDLVPGVMVETPAAALLADQLLAHVQFLSIGTNDLGQYTMAADRMVASVAGLTDPWQPAVLALVDAVGRAGRTHERPVGICGEAAADPALAVVLVGLGVTSLSMVPAALGPVAAVLADTELRRCRELARFALAAGSADEARSMVRRGLPVLDVHGL